MTTTQIGKLSVRRSIEIDAPPERVWEELATVERFRLWYTPAGGMELDCKELEYEPRLGGIFETSGYHQWQGSQQPFTFKGRVLVFERARELTVAMKPDGSPEMYLTFRLSPIEGGRTQFEIIQHGFENYGVGADNVRSAFEHGWNMVVPNALRNLVETGRATG